MLLKVKTLILILTIGRLQSQEITPFGKLQLNIDTNRHLYFGVTPQIDGINYDYLYKIGSDTMYCIKSIFAQGKTTTLIVVDKKFKSFLEKEFFDGFNKIKIDLRHTSINHSFVVSCVMFSGPLERWVSILDEYYLSQVYPLIVTFNSFLPTKEKFSLQFNKKVRDRIAMGQLIDVTLSNIQEKNLIDVKRISLDLEKNIYTISFYDTTENKIKYEPLNFNAQTIISLKSATLKCVNSFSAKNTTLKTTGSIIKTALVRYQFPGIYIETRVKSLDKRTRNVYHDEYFNFLNSKLSKNDKLNY